MTRTIRTTAVAVTIGAVAALAAACVPGATPPAGLSCAWQYVTDESTLNVAYPDAGATYWSMQVNLLAGDQVILDGTYPDARYASIITYNLAGSVVDSITDRDIAPNAGNTNPFADPAAAPGGTYRVEARNGAPVSPGDNTLSATPIGTIIYRVYLSDVAGDRTGGVGLPNVSVRRMDGSVVPVPTCATQVADAAVVDLVNAFGPPTNVAPENPPVFTRPAQVGGLYANPDNAYVGAVAAYQPGTVVVVRGRAPITPDTGSGVSPADPAQQLRYWSLCTNEYRKPYPVTECVYDHQVPLDAEGDYTIVTSTADDRPSNATTADGVAWLDWGSTAQNMVMIARNMLPAAGFTESVFAVAPGADATTAMGAYAPVTVRCDTATFEAGGAAACGLP
jgi:hypothetical protein